MSDYPIGGHCDERFALVREVFEKNFRDDQELGSAFALSLGGEMVVDLWGGFTGPERKTEWDEDTIVLVTSTGKIIVSLCGLMLIDRGLIALDEPIATYWPEFAANGKQDIPVRYIFCHATGLSGLDDLPGMDIWNDWDEVVTRLAAQKTWWKPGSGTGYHSLTFGFLIGELLRRTTGKTIAQFFRDEIGDPLDIDFQFGLPEAEESRLAHIEQVPGDQMEMDKDTIYYRTMGYMMANESNDPKMDIRALPRLNIPAINGVCNARALARVGSLLAMGGSAQGKRFLSEGTAALPYQEQMYTVDFIFGAPVRYGVGFGMASEEFPLPFEKAFHWGGTGGSSCIMIPEHGAAMAYTPSKFYEGRGSMDHRGAALCDTAVACLQEIEKQA